MSCSADRQAKARITPDGVFLEQLERDPARYLPDVTEDDLSGDVVRIDLRHPHVEGLEYPELDMEAVRRIEVADLPVFVVIDDKGNDAFAAREWRSVPERRSSITLLPTHERVSTTVRSPSGASS